MACLKLLSLSAIENGLLLFVDGYHADSEIYSEAVHSFPVAILYGPTVVLTNGTDDGKPKTVAFRSLRGTVEAVEDEPCIQCGFIGGVCYCQSPSLDGKIDLTFRAVVADGVDHKIIDKAFE